MIIVGALNISEAEETEISVAIFADVTDVARFYVVEAQVACRIHSPFL